MLGQPLRVRTGLERFSVSNPEAWPPSSTGKFSTAASSILWAVVGIRFGIRFGRARNALLDQFQILNRIIKNGMRRLCLRIEVDYSDQVLPVAALQSQEFLAIVLRSTALPG